MLTYEALGQPFPRVARKFLETHPCSMTARRLSRELTRQLLMGNGNSSVHSSAVPWLGEDGMRVKQTTGLGSSSRAKKRSWPTGYEQSALVRFLRRQSYRTDVSGLFNPSTYLHSLARRSARLHGTSGLSIRPAPKRSIRCCRYWELEIRFKNGRLTYEN